MYCFVCFCVWLLLTWDRKWCITVPRAQATRVTITAPTPIPTSQQKGHHQMAPKPIPLFSDFLSMKRQNPSRYWLPVTAAQMAKRLTFIMDMRTLICTRISPMNVFRLLQVASERLTTNDALFHEQADTVLGILRSAGVLPHKRSSSTEPPQARGSYDRASL